MHLTYASPGTADYYRRNKKFADGTVLVKEVFGTDHAQMTTGDAHWAKDTKVWFVLIKDSKGRYPNNPLWGDGWGWALFKSDSPDTQVATDYKKDCLGCICPRRQTTGFTSRVIRFSAPGRFDAKSERTIHNAEERISNSDLWRNCPDWSTRRSFPGATRGRPDTRFGGGVHFGRQVANTQRLPQVGLRWCSVDPEPPERRQG